MSGIMTPQKRTDTLPASMPTVADQHERRQNEPLQARNKFVGPPTPGQDFSEYYVDHSTPHDDPAAEREHVTDTLDHGLTQHNSRKRSKSHVTNGRTAENRGFGAEWTNKLMEKEQDPHGYKKRLGDYLDLRWRGFHYWLPEHTRGSAWSSTDEIPCRFLQYMVDITDLAIKRRIALPSLWQPGGVLMKEACSDDPPHLSKEKVKRALDQLKVANGDCMNDFEPAFDFASYSAYYTSPSSKVAAADCFEIKQGESLTDDFENIAHIDNNEHYDIRRLSTIPKEHRSSALDHCTVLEDSEPDTNTSVTQLPDVDALDFQSQQQKQHHYKYAQKISLQLSSPNECITDDVLNIVSRVLFAKHAISYKDGAISVIDPLWFPIDRPSQQPHRPPKNFRPDRLLFLPLHHHSSHHWTLLRVEIARFTISVTHFDPVASDIRANQTREAWSAWSARTGMNQTVVFESNDCPQQTDSTSCGIFVLSFLEDLLQGQPLSTIEPDAKRIEFLYMLVEELDNCHLSAVERATLTELYDLSAHPAPKTSLKRPISNISDGTDDESEPPQFDELKKQMLRRLHLDNFPARLSQLQCDSDDKRLAVSSREAKLRSALSAYESAQDEAGYGMRPDGSDTWINSYRKILTQHQHPVDGPIPRKFEQFLDKATADSKESLSKYETQVESDIQPLKNEYDMAQDALYEATKEKDQVEYQLAELQSLQRLYESLLSINRYSID